LRDTDMSGPTSAEVRQRVETARNRQLERAGKLNNAMSPREVEYYCPIDNKAAALLEQAVERLGLSARAYHRVIKVARTIADLAEAQIIEFPHVSESISYRQLDRQPVSQLS
jgi:magnesium chelatase family protein